MFFPDNVTFFWGKQSPFSNWHTAPMIIEVTSDDGTRTRRIFQNNEQYMMWRKAMLFGDHATAQHIVTTPDPKTCKALGRLVANFDEATWAEHREEIVKTGCRAKFEQHPSLRAALCANPFTVFAEASPYDKIWGIGLTAAQARRTCPTEWPGQNLLGRILTQLRDEMIARDCDP